jgi:serine/threonine protein kinase
LLCHQGCRACCWAFMAVVFASSQGGVTMGFVFAVMLQVAAGLRHLHTLGILHRDLRAANVLVASREPLQVCRPKWVALCARSTLTMIAVDAMVSRWSWLTSGCPIGWLLHWRVLERAPSVLQGVQGLLSQARVKALSPCTLWKRLPFG